MQLKRYQVSDIPRREFLEKSIKGGVTLLASPALLSVLASCNGEQIPAQTEMDPALLMRTVRRALEKGGDFADVYVEHRIFREIEMEESSIKSAKFNISQGAGVRVISGDKTGYAYTDQLTEDQLLHAAEVASYVARGSRAANPVEIKQANRDSYITVKIPLDRVADKKRIDVMKRADETALGYDPRIKMTSIAYNDEVRSRTIVNSEGLLVKDELPLLFFIVQALGVKGNQRHLSRERLSRHCGFEMFDEVSPEEVALVAAREAIVMLDAEECPAGKMDVVMENGWGGVLVHEAVGHPLEADNIAKKIGAFTGKMGQKVASDVFTMVDDGTLSNMRGTINFDDEGTPSQRNVLIREGMLEGYLTDILSARQLGMARTGNGRRENFRYIPIPRMTNTFIESGNDNPEDIIKATNRGIYVRSLSGGSVNPVTGMFNFTCREVHLIDNGEITRPVRGATLTGSCMDIISNIDAVGDNLAFGPGICGKGQSAEVSAGQPTVRLRGMNVGGSRT